MDKTQILVVEDDTQIQNLIIVTLKAEGYRYLTAHTGQAAVISAATHNPDVILLDLGLPDMDGVEVIRRIRSWSKVPIIVISARSEDTDKIDALDSGADDYLTKPFSVAELLARLRVTMRHINGGSADSVSPMFQNGALTIDYAAGCVTMGGEEIRLTPIEYKLLCLLSRNVGKVLTHKYITQCIWGNSLDSTTASLRVFMATLRKKLTLSAENPAPIQTHVGIGYRMIRVEDKTE